MPLCTAHGILLLAISITAILILALLRCVHRQHALGTKAYTTLVLSCELVPLMVSVLLWVLWHTHQQTIMQPPGQHKTS